MPKMKSNRLALKKLRISRKGKVVKHARAATSHNTGKKSESRMRQLRHMTTTDKTNMKAIKRQIPYLRKSGH